MAVPGFQEIMLPLLQLAGDECEHGFAAAVETLSKRLELTDADKKEMLPSGLDPLFYNRVGWARTYLAKALLLEKSGPGRFRITARGLQVLKANPAAISMKSLRQFPEYAAWAKKAPAGNSTPAETATQAPQTPEEALESSYQAIRDQLADELLLQVGQCSPARFERLVVDLLVAMGYGGSRQDAGQAIGGVHDGGIDGIISEDRLGLDVICVQAKRWENKVVGRPDVQAFAGSMMGRKAKKGVFITTSQFTAEARQFAASIETKIVLIDGQRLAQLMIDHGIGVSDVRSYSVKKVDTDYFVS